MNPPLCKTFDNGIRILASSEGYTIWRGPNEPGSDYASVYRLAAPFTNFQSAVESLRSVGRLSFAGVTPWPGDAVSEVDLARHRQQMASLAA